MRRIATITAIAAGLLAIPATASAHPSFNPNALPPGTATESTLVVPHGCAPGGGMPMAEEGEDAPEAVPTVELALEQTAGVTLAPGDVDGWDVTDDGEAWVWSDAGGATTEPIEFPVTITVDGTAGDEIWLKAFQECEDGSSFQWVATPEEDAQWPAVFVAVSDGEASNAAAPEGVGQSMDDMDMGDMDMDDGTEMAMDEDDDMAMDGEEAGADGGLSTPVVVVIAILLVAGVAAIAVRARRT